MSIVVRCLVVLCVLALCVPVAIPAQAVGEIQAISWNISWDQPAWPGATDSRQTPSTVKATPSLGVYEMVFYRFLSTTGGMTKMINQDGIKSNWASGNHMYAVDSIRYSTASGEPAFMQSSQELACSAGPELSISRASNGTTMAGVTNLTGRQVKATLTFNGQSNDFILEAGDAISIGSAEKVGSVIVTEADGAECAELSWNWHLLDSDIVTVKMDPTSMKVETPSELSISVEGVTDSITDYQFAISYDPAMVSFIDIVKEGTLSQNWEVAAGAQDGIVKLAGFGSAPISSDGTLLKLKFVGLQVGSTDLTFDESFSMLHGVTGAQFRGTSLNVQGLTISGKVSYLTGVAIPGYQAILIPGNVSATTNLNGEYQLNAPAVGGYQVSFYKERFVDTESSITAADASRALRCVVGIESCTILAVDADVNGELSSHDAYLIAQAVAGNIPTDSVVGVWTCNQPYLTVSLQDLSLVDQDISCTVIGDATQNWGANPITAATDVKPEVRFGQQSKLGDFILVPFSISYPGIDGAKFELSLSQGQVAEVTANGWNVIRHDNTFVVYGMKTESVINFVAKVSAPKGATMTLGNLQINELDPLPGAVASVTIDGTFQYIMEGRLFLPAVIR